MFFKKSLKYLILDYCLNTFFTGFNKNFLINMPNKEISVKNLHIGMKLSKIETDHDDLVFHNCTVVFAIGSNESGSIRFNYEYFTLGTNHLLEDENYMTLHYDPQYPLKAKFFL